MNNKIVVLNSFEEEQVLRRLKADALTKCDPLVKLFSECVTGKALSIPFSCKKANKDMQDCVKMVF
jgi:COX assembly protein 1